MLYALGVEPLSRLFRIIGYRTFKPTKDKTQSLRKSYRMFVEFSSRVTPNKS